MTLDRAKTNKSNTPKFVFRAALATGCALWTLPGAAYAQQQASPQVNANETDDNVGVGEIVVTAQKRAESINAVGMSINAVTSEALTARGVTDTADLVKLVPGFTFAPTSFATPVYTIRGVGVYESTLSASPAVSVYVDEVALPFPIMTDAVGLDLERVEVLKGPQGTLFGQNSTGGAINYIAAKPTSNFAAGANFSYDNFGKTDVSGFVSGALSSTLNARLAVRTVQGGEWQRSLSRPGDKLGADRKFQGRLLLDWRPTDRLKVAINLNGYRDRSDILAAQPVAITPGNPALVSPKLLVQPLASNKARQADWSPGWPMRNNNRFLQGALRSDYELTEDVTLASVTSYNDMDVDQFFDYDGTASQMNDSHTLGRLKSFNQELRVAGNGASIDWLVGGSYAHDKTSESVISIFEDISTRYIVPGIDFLGTTQSVTQKVNTYAAFGNVNFRATDNLTFQGALRYTKSSRTGGQCTSDVPGLSGGADVFNALQGAFAAGGLKTTPFVQINGGDCFTFDLAFTPLISPFGLKLNEDNVSWRFGATYKIDGGIIYANVSRGYKAGLIPNVAAVNTAATGAVKQERLDAYEAGFKKSLFSGLMHLNGSVFYYKYANKQVRASLIDPIFGREELSVNIPRSRIQGVEAELIARPTDGLDLTLGATYLDTKVTGSFISFNKDFSFGDFRGSRLPYSPKLQAVGDAQYTFPVNETTEAFVGSSITYHSSDNGTFRHATLAAPFSDLNSYFLVDMRAGIQSPDGSWRVSLFGRNLTNKFYTTTTFQTTDTRTRYVGRPRTYGLSITLRTR